ncbi:MAG TPA: hypothetical protein VGE22_12495 [Solimonas sp.]
MISALDFAGDQVDRLLAALVCLGRAMTGRVEVDATGVATRPCGDCRGEGLLETAPAGVVHVCDRCSGWGVLHADGSTLDGATP